MPNGKGSTPRRVSRKTFNKNHDRIFGPKVEKFEPMSAERLFESTNPPPPHMETSPFPVSPLTPAEEAWKEYKHAKKPHFLIPKQAFLNGFVAGNRFARNDMRDVRQPIEDEDVAPTWWPRDLFNRFKRVAESRKLSPEYLMHDLEHEDERNNT